jgi:hypothetical protein
MMIKVKKIRQTAIFINDSFSGKKKIVLQATKQHEHVGITSLLFTFGYLCG